MKVCSLVLKLCFSFFTSMNYLAHNSESYPSSVIVSVLSDWAIGLTALKVQRVRIRCLCLQNMAEMEDSPLKKHVLTIVAM